MTHVFIVHGCEYDVTTVLGVFNTLEKAEAFAKSVELEPNCYNCIDVIIAKVE